MAHMSAEDNSGASKIKTPPVSPAPENAVLMGGPHMVTAQSDMLVKSPKVLPPLKGFRTSFAASPPEAQSAAEQGSPRSFKKRSATCPAEAIKEAINYNSERSDDGTNSCNNTLRTMQGSQSESSTSVRSPRRTISGSSLAQQVTNNTTSTSLSALQRKKSWHVGDRTLSQTALPLAGLPGLVTQNGFRDDDELSEYSHGGKSPNLSRSGSPLPATCRSGSKGSTKSSTHSRSKKKRRKHKKKFNKEDISAMSMTACRRHSKIIVGASLCQNDDLTALPRHEMIEKALLAVKKLVLNKITSRAHENDLDAVQMEEGLRAFQPGFSHGFSLPGALGMGNFLRTVPAAQSVADDGKDKLCEKGATSTKYLGKVDALKWIVTVAVAVLIGIQAGVVILGTFHIGAWKVNMMAALTSSGSDHGLILGYCLLLGYALPVCVISAYLVTYVAPHAGGSGIPEIKAYLNGISMPKAFTFKTWFSRTVGITFVTSAGLFAGTEGPFAHLGAIIASGFPLLFQGKGLERWRFLLTGHFNRCELISQGSAMGVAAAFGAPVGGLLFSLEEAASFWSKQLTWRTFVGNLIAAVIGKLTKSGFQKLNTSGFIEFPDNNASFEIWELVTFLFVGLACGLMGALFCALVQRMLRFRRRKFRLGSPTVSSKRARMVEVICVVIFSMTICFWPAVIMGCSDLPNDGSGRVLGESTVAYEPVISGGICSEDSYSSLAYLLLQPKEAAIKTLFSKSMASGAVLSTSNLLICYCIIFGTTIFTFGSAMPVGLFIPNILAGACLGRAAGQILLDLGFDVHAGVYALMGAAGALAGFSRMTVSLAVIFLEITNNVYMCLPLMLVIYTSKALADQFVPGVYHIVLDSNPEVHLLEDNLSEDHILVLKPLMVHDVCTAEVVVLQEYHTVEQIAAVLLRTSFSTYPILDSRGRVLGTTSRVRLATLLMRMRFNESNKAIFSVLEIADPSPEMTLWSTSVDRAFRHFTSSGLTSLMVVSEQHHLLGILTRTDLARLCHEGEHGVEEVRAILERKKLAVEADQIVRCSRSREFHQRGEQSSPTNSEVSSAWESEMDNSSSNEGSSPGSRHDVGF